MWSGRRRSDAAVTQRAVQRSEPIVNSRPGASPSGAYPSLTAPCASVSNRPTRKDHTLKARLAADTFAHDADRRGSVESLGAKHRHHLLDALGRAADQQAARGLRIGEQVARDRRQRRLERDLGAVAGPVAARRAGDEAVARQLARRRRAAAPSTTRSSRRASAPRAISSAWPARPKPVTSVIACTPGSSAERDARAC